MKIFLSFLQSKIEHRISAYRFWQYYIKNGITEAGYTWVEHQGIDWAYGLVPQSAQSLAKWKEESWEKTINYLKINQVDVFLSYLYPHQIEEQAILQLKKMGIFCVNFFCDNVREFRKAPPAFGVFDLNWVPEYKALSFYEKAGFKFINLPMPMWVEPKYRQPSKTEAPAISFIGSKDIQRLLFFEELIKAHPNLQLDIYGAGWLATPELNIHSQASVFTKAKNQLQFLKAQGGMALWNKISLRNFSTKGSETLTQLLQAKPSFDDYIKITRESSITIGINRYPSFHFPIAKPNTYSRLRDIEAPMLGACYLTEWTAGLAELFEIGEEIETFSTADEFVEKLKELQSNPYKRKKMRIKGQQKAINQLSVMKSMHTIAKIIS